MRSCVWVALRRGSSAGAQLQSRGFVRAGLRRSFFDDAAMLAYVSRRWPRVFQSFCHLPVVEQSDLFRLMYIYDYGGVWSDMDVDLKHPPDRWVELYADAAGLRRKALGCTAPPPPTRRARDRRRAAPAAAPPPATQNDICQQAVIIVV